MPKFTTSAIDWLLLILEERFGHTFLLEQNHLGLKLSLASMSRDYILFPKLEEAFNLSSSNFPCSQWDADKSGWSSVLEQPLPAPCVSKLPEPLIEKKENHFVINYDILGLTYWMLNRIEEVGRTDLDNHGRFPATASHAYKHGYLERPVVDEWLHILGQVIQRMWPMLELKQHNFSMKVSHDVDRPSRYGFRDTKGLIRAIGGDLIIHRSIKTIWQAPYIWLTTKKCLNSQDPYNTFGWMMDRSEAVGVVSAFYFICGGNHANDADYNVDHPVIRNLIREIHARGHEIGLHPSYLTYKRPELIKREFEKLRTICREEGVHQKEWGGRMHYLRWQHPGTLQAWDEAGLNYDSTLSYADRPGFRCGTCFEYPAFDPLKQKVLKLRIRPLIAMEVTVISSLYLGLGLTDGAQQKFLDLKVACEKVNGVFTVLWHNSELISNNQQEIFIDLLESKL